MPLVAVQVMLSDEERDRLEGIVRSPTSEQRMVIRARVVLAAAAGKANRQIAGEVGLSERKVGVWRNRFAERRLEGLRDLPRPGRPRVYDHDKQLEVFKTACSPPPEGETHWTVRSLAETVGVGKSQTHSFLAEADLKPHQVRSWLTSLDPDFDTKQADVCGLYLSAPENAIVVSLDDSRSTWSCSGMSWRMKWKTPDWVVSHGANGDHQAASYKQSAAFPPSGGVEGCPASRVPKRTLTRTTTLAE